MKDQRIIKGKGTKVELCKAVVAIFKAKGLEKITSVAIAKKSKISRATIYHHYKDLDELIFQGLINEFSRLTLASSFDETSALEYLKRISKRGAKNQFGATLTALKNISSGNPEQTEAFAWAFARCRETIESSLLGIIAIIPNQMTVITNYFFMTQEWLAIQPENPEGELPAEIETTLSLLLGPEVVK